MALLLSLFVACGVPDCGPGTHLEGGTCYVDADSDTDSDTDTDADTDSDTDTDTDTDPCAPPDTFWGLVPESLATTTPYDSSYDAGLATVWAAMDDYGAGVPGQTWDIVEATVTQNDTTNGSNVARWHVSDGRRAVAGAPWNLPPEVVPGDRISFTTRSFTSYEYEVFFEQLTNPTIVSSGHPVYVHDLGADAMDFWGRGAEVVRVHGEIVETLPDDCGAGYTCHVLDHGGTRDVIRVKDDNTWDLEPGVTGVCLEAVGGIGTYDPLPDDGDPGPSRLDLLRDGMFRVWAK